MLGKIVLLLSALCLSVIPIARAQDQAAIPRIAILRFGALPSENTVLTGVFDVLHASGFVSGEELQMIGAKQVLDGERIQVVWGDANFDYALANLLMRETLDEAVDVVVTFSTPMTQIAVNMTSDISDPPAILFTSVHDPYASGIAEAPCVKPAHVTGAESLVPYEDIVPMLLLVYPDLRLIGTLYSSGETSGVAGAERITAVAETLGLEVKHRAVTSLADIALATEGLISAGVQAILLPVDNLTMKGLSLVQSIARDSEIPIFHSDPASIEDGALLSAGTSLYYERGLNLGYILSALLAGETDVASIGISMLSDLTVVLNMDLSNEMGVDMADEVMAATSYMIENRGLALPPGMTDLSRMSSAHDLRVTIEMLARFGVPIAPELLAFLEQIEPLDYIAERQALLEASLCTPERVAEQRAQLAAQEG